VSVVLCVRGGAPTLAHALRPLQADPATFEVVVVADRPLDRVHDARLVVAPAGRLRQAGAAAARGDVVLFVDDETLAERGVVSGHARHHERERRRVVVGHTPVRLVVERVRDDFATRMYARRYDRLCEAFERDPRRILTELPGRNFSLRRDELLALGEGDERELGMRCRDAGLEPMFDRSLRALHLYERSLAEFVSEARCGGPTADPLRGRVLRAIVAAAGSAHAWNLQDAAARQLWRVERALR